MRPDARSAGDPQDKQSPKQIKTVGECQKYQNKNRTDGGKIELPVADDNQNQRGEIPESPKGVGFPKGLTKMAFGDFITATIDHLQEARHPPDACITRAVVNPIIVPCNEPANASQTQQENHFEGRFFSHNQKFKSRSNRRGSSGILTVWIVYSVWTN